MFHWICPECGREIPPTMKECAACDPRAKIVPVVQAIAPPQAQTPPPPQEIKVVEEAPDPLLAMAEQIRNAQSDRKKTEQRETPPEAVPVAAKPLEGKPLEGKPVETRPVVARAVESTTAAAKPIEIAASMAGLAAAVGTLPVEAEPVAAPAPAASAPDLAPAAPAPQISITQFFPKNEAIALLAPPEAKPAVPIALAAPASIQLPAPAEPALRPSAPEPVSHPAPRVMTDLTSQPPSGSWLQLAGLQNYTVAAGQSMRPAQPPREILSPDSGPRMSLPGPALPPDLVSRKNTSVVTAMGGPRPAKRVPGWVVSGMLMLGIPLVGAALLVYLQPVQHSSADAKPAAAVEAVAAAAAPAPVSHSLADFVEVTGFRFVVDFNKKSEVHYLVVNHSGAELSDMTLYVTLRTADAKPGQAPLCRFSFRAPGLRPFESKEMVSSIEKLSRSVALPDWQDLRADVQIGQ